ncbi:MAG: FAD-dependent oxidoreductase [Bauldia sp.]|nr:FAD-dependent oxidoreductase [Bauldia sp.]
MTTVAIIGGGIAGLTAAHELRERGFDVTVYERRTIFGGKARSYCSDKEKIKGLPAEHGFRFFPSFYRNVRDTMARIPGLNGSVAKDLVEVPEGALSRLKKEPFRFPTRRPKTLNELFRALQTGFSNPDLGLGPGEAAFAARKIGIALSTSALRRWEELDLKSWWDFMEADRMSLAYRTAIVDGLTQNFVAMDAQSSSTKTVVTILARMFDDFWSGKGMDWILAGPTSEIWIDPWKAFLETADGDAIGVKFRPNVQAVALTLRGKEIVGVKWRLGDAPEDAPDEQEPIKADYYLLCVPLEVARKLVGPWSARNRIERFPALAKMNKATLGVNWMAGISFYSRSRVGLLPGHVAHINSAWALTSIAPTRYWRRPVTTYNAASGVKEVVSVIISDFFIHPGDSGHAPRRARKAMPSNLVAEVLAQLQRHQPGIPALASDNIVDYEIDSSLNWFVKVDWRALQALVASGFVGSTIAVQRFEDLKVELPKEDVFLGESMPPASAITIKLDNAEPLFINTVNSAKSRPEADVGLKNMFLAADYVSTDTDLACMEGANEAARRAVNAILARVGTSPERVRVFTHDESLVFDLPQAIDEWAASGGMANPAEAVFAIAHRIRRKVARFLREERVLPPRRKHVDQDLGVDEKE